MNAVIEELYKCFNYKDSKISNEQKYELYLPKSIKLLKKCLWPRGVKKKTILVLNMELTNIETRLNLNVAGRRNLRRLLFPSDSTLHEFIEMSPSATCTENKSASQQEATKTSVIDIPKCLPSTSSDNSSSIAQTPNKSSTISVILQGIACFGFKRS